MAVLDLDDAHEPEGQREGGATMAPSEARVVPAGAESSESCSLCERRSRMSDGERSDDAEDDEDIVPPPPPPPPSLAECSFGSLALTAFLAVTLPEDVRADRGGRAWSVCAPSSGRAAGGRGGRDVMGSLFDPSGLDVATGSGLLVMFEMRIDEAVTVARYWESMETIVPAEGSTPVLILEWSDVGHTVARIAASRHVNETSKDPFRG